MTRPKVTQNNVHLFIPGKVAKICTQIHRDQQTDLQESILRMYNSPIYKVLSRESSKLWQEGWVYIYQLMGEGK